MSKSLADVLTQDPILAAIERHKHTPMGTAEGDAAYAALISTNATTVLGLDALVRYMLELGGALWAEAMQMHGEGEALDSLEWRIEFVEDLVSTLRHSFDAMVEQEDDEP